MDVSKPRSWELGWGGVILIIVLLMQLAVSCNDAISSPTRADNGKSEIVWHERCWREARQDITWEIRRWMRHPETLQITNAPLNLVGVTAESGTAKMGVEFTSKSRDGTIRRGRAVVHYLEHNCALGTVAVLEGVGYFPAR